MLPSPLHAPQLPLIWQHTPEDILKETTTAIEKYKEALDKVGLLGNQDCNFESVFITLMNAYTDFSAITEQLKFYKEVSATQDLRDTAGEAEKLVDNFNVERAMRLDIFQAKVAAQENIQKFGRWDSLNSEERLLVERMIRDGKRDGLGLSEAKRLEVNSLKKELDLVCSEFSRNLNEEDGSISFTEEELDGVPHEELVAFTLTTEEDKKVYTVKYRDPHFFSTYSHAKDPATRKKAHESYQSRAAVNVPVFSRAMKLRCKIAALLGYDNWADYVTEIKMAKNGQTVKDFLDNLEEKLKPLGKKEIEGLLKLKKKEHEGKGLPFDGRFYQWDYGYYHRILLKQELSIDGLLIKQYFPVTHVVPEVLSIYQHLFGLRFEEVKEGSTWHPEVRLFAVWEKDAVDESGFLGYFYLDLHPRHGKYSHNAVWPLIEGYELPDKSRKYPVLAVVANLAKPTPERPALMRHHDVWVFFHEMGHIFHSLLSRTQFSRFHGFNVTRDFEEAPSQMLENWCWESKVLERLSSHYETKEPLPAELIDALIKTRNMDTGIFYLQQVFRAKWDLIIHMNPVHEDYTHLWCTLCKELDLQEYDKETPGHAAFNHPFGGYDVGYYGYAWSQVFAEDMYETGFKADPLDPARGRRYRDIVLFPGGSRDEMDILKEFLGRPPSNEAFMQRILGVA